MNNKQSIFIRILNWFKLKCPDCKSELKQDDAHWLNQFEQIDIYTCTKCKKEWI